LLVALGACMSEPAADGPRVSLAIAPLQLAEVTDACFDVYVRNLDSATVAAASAWTSSLVWSRENLCSSAFGNGRGDLSYVGPCDASGPASRRMNSVEVHLQSLAGGAGAITDFVNPCPPAEHACILDVLCEENSDAPVVFNLTVMRGANQGFFDIGVSFEDIFCSAKVDCVDDQDAPLTLLFDPETGLRGPTVVAAFACSAGPGADTYLYRDPLVVSCTGGTVTLDPTVGIGNAYTAQNPDPDLTDPVWQYAIYSGAESLQCGASSCAKLYWNVAIGLDLAAANCTISTTMTASDGPLEDFTTQAATSYPVLTVEVPLTDGSGLTCTRHPLQGGNGVDVAYTPVAAPESFAAAFDGEDFTSAAWSCPAGCTTTGLVLHLDASISASYPGTGSTWSDLSGRDNHTTLVDSPSWLENPPRIALDGGTQHGRLPQSADFAFGTSDFSIELWVRVKSWSTAGGLWDRLIFWGASVYTQSLSWNLDGSNGRVVFRWNDAIISTSTTGLAIDTWAQYVFVREGNTIRHYHNGQPDGSTAWALTNVDAAGAYAGYLGRAVNAAGAADSEITADYSRVTVHNAHALTSAEIATHFELYRTRFGL